MVNEEIVVSLFALMYKLKNTQKKYWYDKGINRDRVESVAEHIYGCQMLAYAMNSEFSYNINIDRVILMLLIHELPELIIGDLSAIDISDEEKSELEKRVVNDLFDLIPNNKFIKELYYEFENRETDDAKFAYQIDKAECDLQAKLYDQDGAFLDNYNKDEFARSWISFDRGRINFDENFDMLLEFIMNNPMTIKNHSDNKIQNVVSFYTATNSLKDDQRTGEKIWGIKLDRFGSIAEHIYCTQMLALIIYLVCDYDIDIIKVINILSIHELGEIITGDVSALLKSNSDKDKEWFGALKVGNYLSNPISILANLAEFNKGVTEVSVFCKYCDKLTPDIISKIYDQLGLVDLEEQDNNPLLDNDIVKKYLSMGMSFSDMWILYGQEKYNYPEPFISISNNVLKNGVCDTYSNKLIYIRKKIREYLI